MRLSHVMLAIAALWLTAAEAAAQGRWLRAESTHFIVYSRGSEGDLRRSVEELERFDATLRQLTSNARGVTANKLEVYLLRNRNDLGEVRPGFSQAVLGYYSATPEHIGAFLIDRTDGLDARTILFHEYAHHFMLQYFADAYPAWFTEGFAEYVSTAEIDATATRLGGYEEGRTQPLYDMQWAALADILDPGREGARRVPSYMFYSQSWIFVHYILSDADRRRALSRYFATIQTGADRTAAFEEAFGTTADGFRRDVLTYMRRGISLSTYPPAQADLSMQITRMPQSADDLLLLMARARHVTDETENREELADRIASIASRHPGDPYAQIARARAELVRGQPAAARPIIEPLVAADASNAEAHYMLGMSYLRESEAEGLSDEARMDLLRRARPHFARAFRLNDRHVPTLYHYVRTFPQPMEDSTLEVMLRAQELAPQVEEISFATAVALMHAGAHEQAVPILRAVAYNRHSGSLRRHALITLDAALAGQPPPPPPPEEEEED